MYEEKRFLTVKEASELLNISPGRLYAMCRERRIPHIKAGKCIRIDMRKIYKDAINS